VIDVHTHVLPGVDDGATDLVQALAALASSGAAGVRAIVATPHVDGSTTRVPRERAARLEELDRGWQALSRAAASVSTAVLHRGAEVMLDVPDPDLSDPRLRLAGTACVLVEFPFMAVPLDAAGALRQLVARGWRPLLAHPERYTEAARGVEDAASWVGAGAHLQLNAGSLLGRYGPRARRLGWALLGRGLASVVASDHHARGPVGLAACRAALEQAGASEQASLLFDVNPSRLLADESPLAVPPLRGREPLLRRLFGHGPRA
jgi:protein-tyrosine phosphatase